MEVPRLRVESELQLPTYTTATATRDPSHLLQESILPSFLSLLVHSIISVKAAVWKFQIIGVPVVAQW